jgi:acyl transferase domain-containing protein
VDVVLVKLVRNMQVEQLCLLEAAYRAVEDAGIPIEQLRNTATGIFAAAYTPFLVSSHICPICTWGNASSVMDKARMTACFGLPGYSAFTELTELRMTASNVDSCALTRLMRRI